MQAYYIGKIENPPAKPDGDILEKFHNLDQQEKALKHFADIKNMNTDDMYPEIPEPDYLNDDDKSSDLFPPPPPPLALQGIGNTGEQAVKSPTSPGPGDELLIQPRKLSNPCMESRERQALHKELLYNYKLGKNVLQKPELDKVLEKRKESQRIREWDEQKTTNKRTSLEMKLEERAAKVQQDEVKSMQPIDENLEAQNTPEFLKMHRRITVKSKNENL
ncbi:actin-associated protein FAM107A-like isoform X4 [Gigantopelta aegis]|uniref:actin-associated protein FAM107A-like isoform X4 n=1 Tax=Gigantopelta aegis TaxID=1735272 RepID=UPI001B888E99|nr:actin-associated protein FAM107A-like isoform X4 [Gigantopelta aegis]